VPVCGDVLLLYLLKLHPSVPSVLMCSFPSLYRSFCLSLPTIFSAVWVNLCQISQQPLQVTVCICLIGCQPGSAGPRGTSWCSCGNACWKHGTFGWGWMATFAHLLNTNYQFGNDFSFCSDHWSKRDRRPVQTPFDQSVTQNIDLSWLCACVLV